MVAYVNFEVKICFEKSENVLTSFLWFVIAYGICFVDFSGEVFKRAQQPHQV